MKESGNNMRDYWGYAGKVCVVTGVSSGMGKATAEMLLDLGAEVYGLDCVQPNDFLGKFIQVRFKPEKFH